MDDGFCLPFFCSQEPDPIFIFASSVLVMCVSGDLLDLFWLILNGYVGGSVTKLFSDSKITPG
jgi:hypothetical protein